MRKEHRFGPAHRLFSPYLRRQLGGTAEILALPDRLDDAHSAPLWSRDAQEAVSRACGVEQGLEILLCAFLRVEQGEHDQVHGAALRQSVFPRLIVPLISDFRGPAEICSSWLELTG